MAAEFGLYYPPWNYTGKPDDLLERVAGEVGIDHVTIPVVTGEQTQFRLSRLHDEPYFHTEGGWHFPPRTELYTASVRPPLARWFGKRDVPARICQRAKALGLSIFFRIDVGAVRSLTDRAPHLCQRNAWGQELPTLPACSSNPELRDLLRATLDDLTRYDPSGFELGNWSPEGTVDWPNRGAALQHADVPVLLGMCFCPSCRQIATKAGLDPEQAARSVRVHIANLAAKPTDPRFQELLDKDDLLGTYRSHRVADVHDWLDRLASAPAGLRRFCVRDFDGLRTTGPKSDGWAPLLRVGRDFLRYALDPNCPQVVDWQAWWAFSILVSYPAFEGGSALVSFVTERARESARFFDFEGLEESHAEAITWLKQAVRYARRE